MASNLNYKQVANVTRRTWDVETYEKKAKERQKELDEEGTTKKKKVPASDATIDAATNGKQADEETKEEFLPAQAGTAGPEGSKRAFLKARRNNVDIDSKIGTSEMVSAESAALSSKAGDNKDGVVKSGIGWHCKVCDCFLKDSHTYLDHINGRKHQRNLGYSMRVERSTKDDLMNRLSQLTKKKEEEETREDIPEPETKYEDLVKQKDEEEQRRKEERRKKRQERKKVLQQQASAEEERNEEDEEEEVESEGIDPAMAAMMGFSGFGGGNKTR